MSVLVARSRRPSLIEDALAEVREADRRDGPALAARVAAPTTLYRWRWRSRLPERHGQLLRVLARGTLNSCLVEFVEDGARFITSRNALRKA